MAFRLCPTVGVQSNHPDGLCEHLEITFSNALKAEGTTAWMQEVEQRMELLPRRLRSRIYRSKKRGPATC